MDNVKIGKLIYSLRKEKDLTQIQLADRMNISDKTVSKRERGLGCPDVSLLPEISDILGVDLESLLSGELDENSTTGGSMKRMKFYVCPNCRNIMTTITDSTISCCGKRLLPLEATKVDVNHQLTIERIENDFFISTEHEMTKEHYISFVALVTADSFMIRKLYPEWNVQVRIPIFSHGKLVWFCTQHGLYYMDV